jgi:hypothetical protein
LHDLQMKMKLVLIMIDLETKKTMIMKKIMKMKQITMIGDYNES